MMDQYHPLYHRSDAMATDQQKGQGINYSTTV